MPKWPPQNSCANSTHLRFLLAAFLVRKLAGVRLDGWMRGCECQRVVVVSTGELSSGDYAYGFIRGGISGRSCRTYVVIGHHRIVIGRGISLGSARAGHLDGWVAGAWGARRVTRCETGTRVWQFRDSSREKAN